MVGINVQINKYFKELNLQTDHHPKVLFIYLFWMYLFNAPCTVQMRIIICNTWGHAVTGHWQWRQDWGILIVNDTNLHYTSTIQVIYNKYIVTYLEV